ncbi:HNHc domain containing protein [uncultured Caudovirales phage]|uniref:HNHc domain containing protein n=1 Tax=uncultured Caudovirales phage TaxID=2100421 RepID=A0A6J7WEJ2_9CAUD|nr:HNHc domain containing protein [uncultured Caudovirales phage]
MSELIARADAQVKGLPRYYTGVACKHGHLAERYTASKTCCECGNATANKAKSKDRAKYRATTATWQRENPQKMAQYQRTQNAKRPGKRNLWTMNYRTAKAARMPKWLNDGQLFEMESVYTYCSALRKIGLDYHVDHVVPLRGKSISGLHVPWNLQVLPGRENMSKGNTFND